MLITQGLVVFNTFLADGPVVKHKEVLSATLFSFLSDVNSSLCCLAVHCLMALVDLAGLMSEIEVSCPRDSPVLRVLAFHQCVPGSIPELGIISGLS